MDKQVQELVDQWAKKETIYQIAISLTAVLAIVAVMTKHFKAIVDSLPSLAKAWNYAQKKWFADAIFKKDLMMKMEVMQLQLNRIAKEVQYNGGSVTLSDAFKSLQRDNQQLKEVVLHNKALRDITDLCSDKMLFKVNYEGACTFINDAFLKFFGCRESDILDYGFENMVHDDDVNEMRLKWQKAITTQTPFKDVQRIKDCHGKWHECTVMAFPVLIDDVLKEFSGTITINEIV